MTGQDLVNQLIAKYNGTSFGITGPDTGQCTAVAHAAEQLLGLPIVYGNAVDTFNNAASYPNDYDREPNTPSYVPPVGAIAVWNGNWGEGNGHTAVVTSANVNTFECFEQNDGDNGLAHVGQHNYQDVIGFIIPKTLSQGDQTMPTIVDQNILQLVTTSLVNRQPVPGDESFIGQDILVALTDFFNSQEHKDLIAKVYAYPGDQQQIANLNAQIAQLNQQLQTPPPPAPPPTPPTSVPPTSTGSNSPVNSPANNTSVPFENTTLGQALIVQLANLVTSGSLWISGHATASKDTAVAGLVMGVLHALINVTGSLPNTTKSK